MHQGLEIFFQLVAFLFAISIHESSHAWMAARCGDPTARMLGRVSLNPLRHIDPIGTVVLPLMAAITHVPMIGWAKPTPVDPRNLRNRVVDEILVSIAGPGSNFLVVVATLQVMFLIARTSDAGHAVINGLGYGMIVDGGVITPIAIMLFYLMLVNIWLGIFNLIPIPPLDGSKVVRHFMPEPIRDAYDRFGFIALFALVFFGGNFLSSLIRPFVGGLKMILTRM
jgi:Zn-dependent protease